MTTSRRDDDTRAVAGVVLIVKLTAFFGRLSPYRLLARVLTGRERSARWKRFLTVGPVGGRRLVANDQVDVASVYVLLWLAVLVVMFAVAPAWAGASAMGRVLSALAVGLAVSRYVDLVAYQLGILLDPRQRKLWSPTRSLVLLAVNVAEITVASATVLHVLGDEVQPGQAMGRVDAWVRAVDLVALLEPIRRTDAPLLVAQVLTVASGVLLLILAVGMLLSLLSQEFGPSKEPGA